MQGMEKLVEGYTRYPQPKAEKKVSIEGIGEVDLTELMKISKDQLEAAFDMKMRLTAYRKVIIQRVGDRIPLYLQYVCKSLILNEFEG